MICSKSVCIFSNLALINHFLVENCGMRKSSSSNYIIDGRPVQEIGEQPWMVHIRNNLLNGSCGGSIINKNHILTAAHCIKVNGVVQPASAFTVHVGSIVRIAMKQDTFTVEKATYNSVFSKGLHDIAVLKLSKAIDFKKYKGNALPICLPAKEERGEEYTGQQGTVSGWGKTMRNQVIPTMFLQTASMKILSGEQCKKHYPFIRVSHLCGGPWSRGEYTCGGDSG